MPAKRESPKDVVQWLRSATAQLWPAALGSLSLRRSACIREGCAACESGKQHSSFVLTGKSGGRRFCVYVPEDLEPQVRRMVENGRALQELLQQAGPRYVKALKQERTERTSSRR